MILPVEACRPETPFSHREKPGQVGRNKKDTTATSNLAQKAPLSFQTQNFTPIPRDTWATMGHLQAYQELFGQESLSGLMALRFLSFQLEILQPLENTSVVILPQQASQPRKFCVFLSLRYPYSTQGHQVPQPGELLLPPQVVPLGTIVTSYPSRSKQHHKASEYRTVLGTTAHKSRLGLVYQNCIRFGSILSIQDPYCLYIKDGMPRGTIRTHSSYLESRKLQLDEERHLLMSLLR